MWLVKFLVKRIGALIVTAAALVAVAYLLMYASPGSYSGEGGGPPVAHHKPALYLQTARFVWHSLTFNFGTSFANPSVPIMHQLETAFPISAILTIGAVTLAILVGIPLGALAALHRNTWIDSALTTISLAGQAVPSYVIAVVLVLLFGVYAPGILPVNGWGTAGNVVLPVVALSAGNIGIITRYMRSSLIEVLRQDYMRTAEAKGVRPWRVVVRHGLRNAMTALLTIMGPTFAFTVVSAVWVEQVFSIPGIGSLLAQAFPTKDIPLSITSVYVLGVLVVAVNIVVDLLYRLMDPRVELG